MFEPRAYITSIRQVFHGDHLFKAGEIHDYDGERVCIGKQEWKSLNGKYYYDTGEHRELFGEVQSSWDELVEEDGLIRFASGMILLKKD